MFCLKIGYRKGYTLKVFWLNHFGSFAKIFMYRCKKCSFGGYTYGFLSVLYVKISLLILPVKVTYKSDDFLNSSFYEVMQWFSLQVPNKNKACSNLLTLMLSIYDYFQKNVVLLNNNFCAGLHQLSPVESKNGKNKNGNFH